MIFLLSLNYQYSNFRCPFVHSFHFLCQGASHLSGFDDYIMDAYANDRSAGFHPDSKSAMDTYISSKQACLK